MRNVLKNFVFIASLIVFAGIARATDIGYSGTFVGTEGLATANGGAVSANYTRNFNATGDRVTLQVVSSTYTVAVSTNFGSNNYTLNTPTITVTSNRFTTGLAVLYSTGSVAISGLTDQTTYFISVVNPNNNGIASTFKLASSLANAAAGTGIVLASSSTSTNRYTLAPLAFTNTGAGGIQLQASNDGSNFVSVTQGNYAITITSVTFAAAGNDTLWDLGPIQYKYLRLKETPPTTGAMTYTVTSNERYSYGH